MEGAARALFRTVGLWFPNDWPEPEIKWALVRRFWGQGFAIEAAKAVQCVAVEHFGRPPISLISARNAPSIKFAENVGATLEAEVLFRGNPYLIYRHPARSGVGRGGVVTN